MSKGQGSTIASTTQSAPPFSEGSALLQAAIVESSDDAIVGKSLDGIVVSWNGGAQRMFGYSAQEIIGQPISILMPPDHKEDMHQILSRIRRGERVDHFETVRLKKNGETIPVSLSVSPVRDSSGRIIGAAKIARDITAQKAGEAERERLYREAQEAARAREEFLSIAGHELRTPLTALQLRMRTLRRRIEADDKTGAIEVLEKVSYQVDRLAQLTEDLLDVTRITAGRLAIETEETDLGELVREVANYSEDSAQRAGSEIRIDAPPGVIGLWDRLRLAQVVTNLLSNAIKFGGGMPIEVRVESDADWASLTIQDRGIGISEQNQAKIFDRFERVVSRRSYGGMGLGLWIARQIVDGHGGRIRVESRLGAGSSFRVELPRKPPARATR